MNSPKKIMIVNGYNSFCKDIPMGTFGLCDFLHQEGIAAKIFNAAVYSQDNYLDKLRSHIRQFKPNCIGLILHWKELLENIIFLSRALKEEFPSLTVVAGGFTAGFLAEELLMQFKAIDFVIKGDAEKPLALLIQGTSVKNIPNLAYRQGNKTIVNKKRYLIDGKTLSRISFSNLEYLIDKERYIKQVNAGLGFSLFIGRGCVYNCLFCGGSFRAFRAHSNRSKISLRNTSSVVRDLKLLLPYIDKIFICYEANLKYIYSLFRAMLREDKIARKFKVNYGAWHLPDDKLLNLFAKVSKFDRKSPSIMEISPEAIDERDRKVIRGNALYFSDRQLLRSVHRIMRKLNNSVRVRIYYSRYHNTAWTKKKLISDLISYHKLKEHFYNSGFAGHIEVFYSQLATDVGSAYWDLAFNKSGNEAKISLLLRYLQKSKLANSNPNDFPRHNLLIYVPKQLSRQVIFKHEQLINWLQLLINKMPNYYFIITRSIGVRRVIKILESKINQYYNSREWRFFKRAQPVFLLDIIQKGLKARYGYIYGKHKIFFDNLFEKKEGKWLKNPNLSR